MQIGNTHTRPSRVPPTDHVTEVHDAIAQARAELPHVMGALWWMRLGRVALVRGPGTTARDALVRFALDRPHLVVVFRDAQELTAVLRDHPTWHDALRGRVMTAEQVARGVHRGAGLAGVLVTTWLDLTERQRVALESDLRPLVAIAAPPAYAAA